VKALNKIIEISFYALFFFVPLIFFGNTSELFEFNKMWLAFGLTIVIATAWISKMVLQRSIIIQKTPLDIAILLFLASQTLSTIFSLDQHVSWWGYYSRFNGGLASTISYIILYYAFVTNLNVKNVLRIMTVSFVSGLIVALWAFPAHFGYDPTCFLFRGTLDTSCWTDQFKPTIRTFSTLGQPAWLAAYLALLIPSALIYTFKYSQDKNFKFQISNFKFIKFLLFSAFLYISLLFSHTRAGSIGFFIADALLFALLFIKLPSKKQIFNFFIITHLVFAVSSFFFGAPIDSLEKFTFWQIMAKHQTAVNQSTQSPTTQTQPTTPIPAATAGESNSSVLITDSGEIRKLVWKGAIEAWKANPILGTGVETYAFAYYKYKSPAHNLTSEWDYLYNKAHNEYLNYLATTGILGLGTYLLMIGWFMFLAGKWLLANGSWHEETKNHSPHAMSRLLTTGLLAGYLSILITNFFGFSVVIVNVYLFLIPAFVFFLADMLDQEKKFILGSHPAHSSTIKSQLSTPINPYQWTAIVLAVFTAGYLLFTLFWYWYADVDYALGNNLDKIGQYQQAYPKLLEAVTTEPNEPVFKDELSVNTAVLATALYAQKDMENGNKFAQNAIALSDDVVTKHPNNVVYWKTRVRVLYTLAQSTPENQQTYLVEAEKAIDKAAELAPNDAKVSYNQGVLHGQVGDVQKGLEILQQSIKLKPNYHDAYIALGLFYHQLAVDKDGKVTNPEMQQKAVDTYQYILKTFDPNDKQVKDALKEWQK
jgi:putative inorganic carbon (HCO3(-)) transporter